MKSKNIIYLSIAAALSLQAAEPMKPESMSTDRGGLKFAIDAYSDGAGAYLIDEKNKAVMDNSAMNSFVFKYGEAAKENSVTLSEQINSISAEATAAEKLLVNKIPVSNVSINPPVDGSACNDFNPGTIDDKYVGGDCKGTSIVGDDCSDDDPKTIDDKINSLGICVGNNVEGKNCSDLNVQTIGDVYHNGICAGVNVEGNSCSDGDFSTIFDKYHNGVCAGTNVEDMYCDDSNPQTINDAYKSGVCIGTNVEGLTCNDSNAQTINDKYHNGVCAGTNVEGQTCNDSNAQTINDKYVSGVCVGKIIATPSCSDGTYTWNTGTKLCEKGGVSTYAASIATYNCPSGGTLSGTTCNVSSSYAATGTTAYTSCPSNGSYYGLSSNYVLYTTYATTCKYRSISFNIYTTKDRPLATTYSCPSGGTLSGTACNVYSSYAASIATYNCPSGGTLSGTTCTINTLVTTAGVCQANYTYDSSLGKCVQN